MSIFQSKSQLIQALFKISGIGNAKIINLYNKIIKNSDNLDDICTRLTLELRSGILCSEEIISKVNQDIKYANQKGISILTIADTGFPLISSDKVPNSDIPTILYYIGDISLLADTSRNVSIIGTRSPDDFGANACKILTKNIAKIGYNVVSGLARGCDYIAHDTCLTSGTKTIAILPTPPDNTKINKELAQQIIKKGGLLVSEFLYPDHSATEYSKNCAKRDKLIAMYSQHIILVSSGTKSGSAITIKHAQKYGTSIAVIKPNGHFDPEKFSLNIQLLEEQAGSNIDLLIDESKKINLDFLISK